MQKDVHLLTADEKTVVLSRERFAADNRAPRSLRTSPTLASKPFDRTARVWRKIRDQIFRKSCSKIYLFRLPWNGILSWERRVYYCERKLRLVFPDYKYKYYGFDVVNSNFAITRLVFIYDYKHESSDNINEYYFSPKHGRSKQTNVSIDDIQIDNAGNSFFLFSPFLFSSSLHLPVRPTFVREMN